MRRFYWMLMQDRASFNEDRSRERLRTRGDLSRYFSIT
jgi:hypothetical protein